MGSPAPAFYRFPHTPHLAWLGAGSPRADKVLSEDEAAALLSREVVVEEKIDGANLGLSTSEDGELLVQNRGKWLSADSCQPQFRSLWQWLAPRALRRPLAGSHAFRRMVRRSAQRLLRRPAGLVSRLRCL